jgi:hypothetical protein
MIPWLGNSYRGVTDHSIDRRRAMEPIERTNAQPHSSSERTAALSGVVFVVLLMVHAALQVDGLPSLRDPAEVIVQYLSDKRLDIQVGAYLQGLAMIAYAWFFGSIWRHLRPAEGGPGRLSVIALVSTAISVALVAVHIAVITSLAIRADASVDAGTVSLLYLMAFVVLAMNAFATAAALAALGVLILRTRELPRWSGWFSVAVAVAWLAAGLGASNDSDEVGALGFVAFVSWLVWTATVSILLTRRTPKQAPAPVVLDRTASSVHVAR